MIYIVSGYMGSSTSAFMRALEAGGMPVVNSRLSPHWRRAHEPRKTYYEPSRDELLAPDFPLNYASGTAVKVMAQQLWQVMPREWNTDAEYKCVWISRDAQEIQESYARQDGLRIPIWEIEATLLKGIRLIHGLDRVAVVVRHEKLMSDPAHEFRRIRWPIDPEKAAAVIDPGRLASATAAA